MSLLRDDKKALVVAMDHGMIYGLTPGLEDPGRVIDTAVEAGADAILVNIGVVKRYRERLIGHIPTILRLDGGPTIYREEWLAYTEYSLLHSVEDALFLGVDAVVVMAFVGSTVELETFRIVSKVAGECMQARLPLIVEALPHPDELIPARRSVETIASAARVAFEHGADFVKTYYAGSPQEFGQVVNGCPVPILVAGGPKMDTDEDALQVVHNAMQAGAAGAAFGRNIWQSKNMAGTIKALQHIIHNNGSVREAMSKLNAS